MPMTVEEANAHKADLTREVSCLAHFKNFERLQYESEDILPRWKPHRGVGEISSPSATHIKTELRRHTILFLEMLRIYDALKMM